MTAIVWLSGLADWRFKTETVLVDSGSLLSDTSGWSVRPGEIMQTSPEGIHLVQNELGFSKLTRYFALNQSANPATKMIRLRVKFAYELQQETDVVNKPSGLLVWFELPAAARTATTWVIDVNKVASPYTREVFYDIPEQAKSFIISSLFQNAAGTLSIEDLTVTTVSWNRTYLAFALVICVVCIIYYFLLISKIFRKVGWLACSLFAAIALVLAIGISAPATLAQKVIIKVFSVVSLDLHSEGIASVAGVLNIGHVIVFAVLSSLLIFFKIKISARYSQILVFVVLLILLTEGAQLHIIGRNTRLGDVLLDVAGVLIGSLFVMSLTTIIKRLDSKTN